MDTDTPSMDLHSSFRAACGASARSALRWAVSVSSHWSVWVCALAVGWAQMGYPGYPGHTSAGQHALDLQGAPSAPGALCALPGVNWLCSLGAAVGEFVNLLAREDPLVLLVCACVCVCVCVSVCLVGCCYCAWALDDPLGSFNLGSALLPSLSSRLHDVPGTPPAPGATGLQNLGNTCFMNSSLQCLSAVKELKDYFVGNEFKRHLNTANPSGTQGEVAHAYAALLQQLWSGKYVAVAPREFRDVLGRHAARFAGHDQQDNSEFLMTLLDKLHEDLNQGSEVLQSPSNARYRMTATSDANTPMLTGMPAAVQSLQHRLRARTETTEINHSQNGDTAAAGAAAHPGGDAGRDRLAGEVPALALPASAMSNGVTEPSEAGDALPRIMKPIARRRSSETQSTDAALVLLGGAPRRRCDPLSAEEAEMARKAWKLHVAKHRSIIADLFQGQQLSRTVCPSKGCGYVARNFETVMYLPLPLPPALRVWRPRLVNIEMLMECARKRGSKAVDVSTATVDGKPLITRHTLLLSASSTARDLQRAAESWAPGLNCMVAYVRDGRIGLLEGHAALAPYRTDDVCVYALPPVAATAKPSALVPIISRSRRWSIDPSASYFAHLHTNRSLPTDPSSEPASFPSPQRHPVKSEHDLYSLPEAFPDYFAQVFVCEGGLPLLVRVHEGDPLRLLRDCAELWAVLMWGQRSQNGVGMLDARETPFWAREVQKRASAGAAEPISLGTDVPAPDLYWPALRWVNGDANACGMGGQHECKHGCSFEAFVPVRAPPESPQMEALVAAPMTAQDIAELPPCLSLDWFSPDDLPAKRDHLCLNAVWRAYEALNAERRAAISETRTRLADALDLAQRGAGTAADDEHGAYMSVSRVRVLESTDISIPDPIAVCPRQVIPALLIGMTFSPAVHAVEDDSVPVVATPGAMSPALRPLSTSNGGTRGPHAGVDLSTLSTDAELDCDLERCLDLYTRETVLSDDNLYACPKCSKRVAATQGTTLVRTPDVLIIVLKRFIYLNNFGDMGKVETLVKFPVTGLDISSWVAGDNSYTPSHAGRARAPGNVYDLIAVSHHTGTLTAGHYTTYAKNAEMGTWYYYNDGDVRAVGGTEADPAAPPTAAIVTPAAYVLVYKRRSADALASRAGAAAAAVP